MTGLRSYRGGNMRKKTKAEQIASIPIQEVIKRYGKNRKELEKMLRTLRTGYNRRVSSFKRKDLISHAQIAFEKEGPPIKKPVQLTKMTYNQLIYEIARYSKFFTSQTSSEKGIKAVNKAQDIRLFGADNRGRPKHSMSTEERQRFWDLYEEFKNQNPSKFVNFGYNMIQQTIADIASRGNELTTDNMMDLLNKLDDALEESYNELIMGDVPNVYSGDWNPFA